MRLGTFTKNPIDNLRFEIDYSEWLEAPEILLASEAVSDPDGLVVSNISVVDDTSVVLFVGSGEDGESYNLLVTITTNGGQIRQDYIVFTVRSP